MKVGVVDYTVGNLGSVFTAIRKLGHEPVVLTSPEEANHVDAVVLPGVGTYGRAYALVHKFREVIEARPTLAICLGMQLLFEESEEGGGRGLGIFKGRVVKIRAKKVPNIGWRYVHQAGDCPYFIPGYYYFLHSYGVEWTGAPEQIAYVELERRYVAALCRDQILAVQFHPERSSKQGLALISTFLQETRK